MMLCRFRISKVMKYGGKIFGFDVYTDKSMPSDRTVMTTKSVHCRRCETLLGSVLRIQVGLCADCAEKVLY